MIYRIELLLMILPLSLQAMEETSRQKVQDQIIPADIYQRTLVHVLGTESPRIQRSLLPYFISRIENEHIDPADIESIILSERRSSTGTTHELKVKVRRVLEQSLDDVLSHHRQKSHNRKRWLRSSIIANGITAGVATILILVLQFSQSCQ